MSLEIVKVIGYNTYYQNSATAFCNKKNVLKDAIDTILKTKSLCFKIHIDENETESYSFEGSFELSFPPLEGISNIKTAYVSSKFFHQFCNELSKTEKISIKQLDEVIRVSNTTEIETVITDQYQVNPHGWEDEEHYLRFKPKACIVMLD